MPPTNQQKSSPFPTRRKFLQTATAAAVSGMVLSSCGWKLAEIKATGRPLSASNQKTLDIFTWAGYIDDALLKRFKNETGIEVRASVYASNEEMLGKIQASGGGEYSIIYPSDYIVSQMAELGLLKELDHSRLQGLENLFPRFQNPPADVGLRYSVPMAWGTTVLIYNTARLKSLPEDWNYLWEHQLELAKQMTLLDDPREVIGAVLKMLGYSYNSTDAEQVKQAYEKLVTLKPAIASFTTDAWQNQILAGDLLLAMCYSADANKISRQDPKLQYVIPRSGSSVWMDTIVIPKTAPNPDGAYSWINFMLQPDVAAQICERLSFATPNQVAYNQLAPQIRNNEGLFPPEDLLQKCESIAQVGKFVEVYDKYWTRLRSS